MNENSPTGNDSAEDDRDSYGRWITGIFLHPLEKGASVGRTFAETVNVRKERAEELVRDRKDQIESELAEAPRRIRSMSRREMIIRTVGVAGTAYTAIDISDEADDLVHDTLVKPPTSAYNDYWPNELHAFADDYGMDDAYWLTDTSQVGWNRFVNRSTSMLSIANDNDEVDIVSVYLRGYNDEFFDQIRQTSQKARRTTFYIADAIGGSDDRSAIELHQEREVLTYRHFVKFPSWRTELTDSEEIFDWIAVPHINDVTLNNVRSLLHSLRAFETAYYFMNAFDNVRFQPISNPRELPLRGRLVTNEDGEAKIASFLKLPKGVIGTSNAPNGHILMDRDLMKDDELLDNPPEELIDIHRQFAERYLQTELEELRDGSREPYALDEIPRLHASVRNRIERYLDEARREGTISDSTYADVSRLVDSFRFPESWRQNPPTSFDEWSNHMEKRARKVDTIREDLEREVDESFLETPSPLSATGPPHRGPKPRDVYEEVLKYQGI